MLTPQYLLPPPEPFDYCYEWETGYGIVRKFSATPHHGMPPTRAVALYTADQMRAALAAVPAQPVAWLCGDGHPQHISAVQTITERRIYGPRQPLYAAPPAVPVVSQQLTTEAQAVPVPAESQTLYECVGCNHLSLVKTSQCDCLANPNHQYREWIAHPKEQP